MKYGLLTSFFPQLNNYGDFIQTIAIEYLYQRMGITESEIVHIGLDDLICYEGEEVLLPWNYAPFVLPVNNHGKLTFSKNIIPVFLGFSLTYYDWERKFVSIDHFMYESGGLEFLRHHEPIGCRDAYTANILSQYGIRSYLQGCITNILPRRSELGKTERNKVFLIDCNAELLKHIPRELLDQAEALPNEFFANEFEKEQVYNEAKRHYTYLSNRAALMVSGRFHIVTPCYAMGIPSIFVERFMRFDQNVLVNPGIPQYTYEEFASIDWYPEPEDFEEVKEQMIEMSAARIKEVHARRSSVPKIKDFYQPRVSGQVLLPPRDWDELRIQEFVKKYYQSAERANFYIWGAKPDCCRFGKALPVEYVRAINPRIEFSGWIDTFRTGALAGAPILKPGELKLDENTFLIVFAEKAIEDARKKFYELGMREEQYCVCTYIRNIEPRDL